MRFAEPRETTVRLEWQGKDVAVGQKIFYVSSLVTVSSCIAGAATDMWPLLIGSFFASFGVPVAAGLLGLRSRPAPQRARFRLADDALLVEIAKNTATFRRADMRSAWIEQQRFVHVAMRAGGSVVLDAGDADTAEALISDLGFAKDQRVLEMALAGRIKSFAAQRFAAIGLLPLTPLWMFAALLVGVSLDKFEGVMNLVMVVFFTILLVGILGGCIGLVGDLHARKVVVGSDGVRIPHKKRALRYADIAVVEAYDEGVRIVKKDRSFVDLPLFRDGGFPFEGFVDARDALIKRIESWKRASERTDDEAKFALLERKAQPFAEWKKQLMALSQPRGGYRVATLTAEDLERVITDPETTAEKRVAATVALSGLDRERARERIRVVAPTCADPQLRVALERAAAAELDEAYLEAEAESRKGR
jgi:hypothetical protein